MRGRSKTDHIRHPWDKRLGWPLDLPRRLVPASGQRPARQPGELVPRRPTRCQSLIVRAQASASSRLGNHYHPFLPPPPAHQSQPEGLAP